MRADRVRENAVKLKVFIYEAQEGGYWAKAPAIPGCVSQGETLDEVKANILDALQGLPGGARGDGDAGGTRLRGNGGMRTVSGKRFGKILGQHGWVFKRTTRSSLMYTRPGNPAPISAPVHANQDLKKGLQADLMKQAGLTEADL